MEGLYLEGNQQQQLNIPHPIESIEAQVQHNTLVSILNTFFYVLCCDTNSIS